MRFAIAALLLAACTGSETDLEPNEQGVCSNLDEDACRARATCQLAYLDSGFQPRAHFMHCLALEDVATRDLPCEAQERDGCRARKQCSPIFWQELGPDDGPVGDPRYKSCGTEDALRDAPR